MIHHFIVPLLLLLLPRARPLLTDATSAPGMDVMAVAAYVDEYRHNSWPPVVLATADGGALLAMSTIGCVRMIKVDSNADYEWATSADFCNGVGYYPTHSIIVDDTDPGNPYVFLAGGYNGLNQAYIIKYRLSDGTILRSSLPLIGSCNTFISSLLLLKGSGTLLFSGYYYTDSGNQPWFGTIDRSTLALYSRPTLTTPSAGGNARLLRLVEDPSGSVVVFLGTVNTNNCPWVGAISRFSWDKSWEFYSTSVTGDSMIAGLLVLSAGNYAAMYGKHYLQFTASGFVADIPVTGGNGISWAPDGERLMFVGYSQASSDNFFSFSYVYDYKANVKYDVSTKAEYKYILPYSSSKHPSHQEVWASCMAVHYRNRGVLVKLRVVTPLVCGSGQVNYFNTGCYSPINSGCYGLCATCIFPNDPNSCLTAASDGTTIGTLSLFAGRCATNGVYYNSATGTCATILQSSCHPLCGGDCIAPMDATKCTFHCDTFDPYIDSSDISSNTCKCNSSSTVSITGQRCVLTTGCYSLCGNGECVRQHDPYACVSCVEHATGIPGEHRTVHCVCDDASSVFNGTACAPLTTEGCHPLCKRGCTVVGDPYHCADCVRGMNVVEEVSETYYKHCSCLGDTTLIGNTCGYDAGCDEHCDGCIIKDNSSACVGCAAGIPENYTSDLNATCRCPNGTVYYNYTCAPVIFNRTVCHPLCGESGCLLESNRSTCVGACASSFGVTATLRVWDAIECGCRNGTKLISQETACAPDLDCDPLCERCADRKRCAQCPAQMAGAVLSDGKCVCSAADGYVLLAYPGARCILKGGAASAATEYSGDSVIAVILISSAVVPGSGSAVWKYLNLAQELMLLAVINSRFISPDLISIYQGFSFVNFDFVKQILTSILPDELQGNEGYNALDDNAQYHPSLTGKMFLVNIGQYILFALLTFLGYAACWLLGRWFAYFRKLRDSYVFGGLICCVQASYVDVLLAGFVQLRYFGIGYSTFYALNSFASILGIAFMATFLGFSVYVFMQPTSHLSSDDFKPRFGALYEDVRQVYPSVATSLFTNLRVAILAGLLVALAKIPPAQTVSYVMLSVVGLAWDLYARPYDDSKLMKFQMLFLDSAKLAAGAGYFVLALPRTSQALAEWVCTYVISIFVVAIVTGLIVSILQQATAAYESVKDWICGKRIKVECAYVSTETTQNRVCSTTASIVVPTPAAAAH